MLAFAIVFVILFVSALTGSEARYEAAYMEAGIPDTEFVNQIELETEPETETETEAEMLPETEARSQLESEIWPETEAESQPESEIWPETEVESHLETETASDEQKDEPGETLLTETEHMESSDTENGELRPKDQEAGDPETGNSENADPEAGNPESRDPEPPKTAAETETAVTLVPEPEIPSAENSETEASESEDPGTGDNDLENSETENPGTESFETEASETENPSAENSETEASESEDPGTGDNDLENSETENLGTESLEPEALETENQETECFETEFPEPENPEESTEPQSPEPAEPVQEPASRGVHYELSGEDGAWHRDANGLLWVRRGTSLYVSTMQEGGYNQGTGAQNLQTDGVLTFSLKQTDDQGIVVRESQLVQEAYYVDGEAPGANIEVEGSRLGDMIYALRESAVSVRVEPDGKSGWKSMAYQIRPCDSAGNETGTGEWVACSSSETLHLTAEGIFLIYVRTEDQVGNVAFTKSSPVYVDGTAPSLQISGVTDQTANAGDVCLRVSCEDRNYKTGSLQVWVTGVNNGKAPGVRQSHEEGGSAWIEFYDFPKTRSYDDVYTMTVTAEDLAGNVSRQQLNFSVNRFGSVYDLAGETKNRLQQYFWPEAADIVFLETNIDYVGSSQVFCRHNGILKKLQRDRDYTVSMQGSPTSWKQYCYTVPAGYFSEEGVYELLLASGDQAENKSDTGRQNKRVTFVLDRTAPTCVITGVDSKTVYEEEAVTVCVTPADHMGLRCMRVYRNSELLEEYKEPQSEETVKIKLTSDADWQTLQVWLCDLAGNEYWSEELPVFVGGRAEETAAYHKSRPSARELAAAQTDDEKRAEPLAGQKQAESEGTVSDEQEQPDGAKAAGWSDSSAEMTDREEDVSLHQSSYAKAEGEASVVQSRSAEPKSGSFGENGTGMLLLAAGIVIFCLLLLTSFGLTGKN